MKIYKVLILGTLLIFTGCEREAAKKEAKAILENAKTEAEQILNSAKHEAQTIKEKAIKKAIENAKNAEYEYLKSKINGVKKYKTNINGWINVNEKYLSAFKLQGSEIWYEIYNQSDYGAVKPSFSIMIYDENGVSVAATRVGWVFDTVEPGQKRKDKESIWNRISNKTPKYYKVKFD